MPEPNTTAQIHSTPTPNPNPQTRLNSTLVNSISIKTYQPGNILCRYHTYPTQYATSLMVACCLDTIHNMLLNGTHCVESILWLNRAHCRSKMHPVSTYSSHDVRKRNHRIHSMHKQQNDVRSGLFQYFYLKYIALYR